MNSVLEKVHQVCETVRKENQVPLTFKKLISRIRKSFKDRGFDLAIRASKSNILSDNQFYIEAYYYEEKDFNDDPPIEVIIYHQFGQEKSFRQQQITDFLIQIYDAVVHELRHQHQYQVRDYDQYITDRLGYAAYLADPDELDAYAFSIAIDLLRNMPKSRARMYMTRFSKLSRLKQQGFLVSPSLNSYVRHFKRNPILKRLAKKVYKHIESIDTRFIFK